MASLRYTVIDQTGVLCEYAIRDNHGDPGFTVETHNVESEATARCAELNAIELIKARKELDVQLANLADERPALTLDAITPDRCNIPDRVIEGEIRAFRNRYDGIDVTDLADENGNQDPEKWEHIAGGRDSERFEVREIPDPDYAPASEDDETPVVYAVVDTEGAGDGIVETFMDEDDAESDRDERNREAFGESLYGFPFAHNHGYVIDGWDVESFAAAGFLVWLYDGDKYIVGIDGGGYSFDGAHWAPLFFSRMAGVKIETETGPRIVAGQR